MVGAGGLVVGGREEVERERAVREGAVVDRERALVEVDFAGRGGGGGTKRCGLRFSIGAEVGGREGAKAVRAGRVGACGEGRSSVREGGREDEAERGSGRGGGTVLKAVWPGSGW